MALLRVVLAAALLVLVGAGVAWPVLPPGGTFTDDNGNIHEPNIEAIAAAGITKGCNPPVNDRYCPSDAIDRGQMAAFIRRALDLPYVNQDFFSDDDGSIFEADINAIAAAGITKGCNPPANTQFCPTDTVKRGPMAAFLKRALDLPNTDQDFFSDDDGSIFEADINAIAAAGVTLGCNPPANTNYCPDSLVKRDQMASFFARALNLEPITPPPPDLVIGLLDDIPVRAERPDGYDRDLFDHWSDLDGDGCDTREEVLIRDAKGTAQVDAFGCRVIEGDWYSFYDGVWYTNPSDLDIDHVVALKEAWDSGAWAWSASRREAFANDLNEPAALIAVSASSNRSKGADDPAEWLPRNRNDVCRYIAAWVIVKAKWDLSMDQAEADQVRGLLSGDCEGTTTSDAATVWPSNPPPASTTTTKIGLSCDPAYPTVCIPPPPPDLDCGDITHRNFTVLPADPHRFDGDGDGVGCET